MAVGAKHRHAKKIGEAIRAARESQQLTQTDLGAAVENSKTTVSNWERGLSVPTAENLRELCIALKVPPQQLLHMKPHRQEAASAARQLTRQLAKLQKVAKKADADLIEALSAAEQAARSLAGK